MTKRMLIDATHEEETRVAVVEDSRLIEFDYESKYRKPLKGSIFLAKVTRVEPSLQAAFVNFGGNRHGFLPFSEIHPDYFRIPIADREALLAEQKAMIEAQEALEAEEEAAEQAQQQQNPAQGSESPMLSGEEPEDNDNGASPVVAANIEPMEDEGDFIEEIGGDYAPPEESASTNDAPRQDRQSPQARPSIYGASQGGESQESGEESEEESSEDSLGNRREDEYSEDESLDNIGNRAPKEDGQNDDYNRQGQDGRGGRDGRGRGGRGRFGRGRDGRNAGRGRGRFRNAPYRSQRTETYGDGPQDAEERFRYNLRRKYKIQEVIKRGQIMLIQVSKEERGNKGAAVTSYLSLPGRYCVLMPNSPRAGGVSRKIANYQDRAKMREMLKEMQVPQGMSVILRTAGVSRTKVEIKRDLDYLMKLWDTIREDTLQSSAPAMIYEEANLIKRAVRDLYGRDIDEIVVSGEEGFKTARNYMKMMMPSHTKKVEHYEDQNIPLFHRYHVEAHIAAIGESQVTLPSGGYLVINQTEALVSVDVNSGKSTKERHIEETALRTNLEAAAEVARQLKLRDLGGLVVIDFIDMEDRRNNAKVERKMRDALSTDRARIQMGRISSFGLMELSRQRLNPSLAESQYELCSHCAGMGRTRTPDAASVLVMRALEEHGIEHPGAELVAHVPPAVALYILNHKRKHMTEIEQRYQLRVLIRVDEGIGASKFRVEVSKAAQDEDDENAPAFRRPEKRTTEREQEDDIADDATEAEESEDEENQEDTPASDESQDNRNRHRGRRGGRGRGRRGGRDREHGRPDRPYQDRPAKSSDFAGDETPDDGEGIAADAPDYQDESDDQNFNIAPGDNAAPRHNGERRPRRGRYGRGRWRDDQRPDNRSANNADRFSQPENQDQPVHRPLSQPETPASVTTATSTPIKEPRVFTARRRSSAEQSEAPPAPRAYETVNTPPQEKKRGWWNKLVE